jgi:hypothetical protein
MQQWPGSRRRLATFVGLDRRDLQQIGDHDVLVRHLNVVRVRELLDPLDLIAVLLEERLERKEAVVDDASGESVLG